MKIRHIPVAISLILFVTITGIKIFIEQPLERSQLLSHAIKNYERYLSEKTATIEERLEAESYSSIRSKVSIEASSPDVLKYLVVNSSGEIIASKNISDEGKNLEARFPLIFRDVYERLPSHPTFEIIPSANARSLAGVSGFYVTSLKGEREIQPSLIYIEKDLTDQWKQYDAGEREDLLVSFSTLTALAVLMVWFFNRGIRDRLASLLRTFDLYASGSSTARVEVRGRDELSELGDSINQMLDSISSRDQLIKRNERFISLILENSIDGVIIINSIGRITQCNASALKIFGYENEREMLGIHIERLMPEQYRAQHPMHLDRKASADSVQRALNTLRDIEGVRKDGTIFPVEIGLCRVDIESEIYFAGFVRDITERKSYKETLRSLAYSDQRTSLLNRNGLEQELMKWCETSGAGDGGQWMFYMMCIDHLNDINRSLGFDFGDNVIKTFAESLLNHFLGEVTLSYIGSNRFLLGVTPENLKYCDQSFIARKLSICETEQVVRHGIPISVTMGIYACHGAETLTEIMGGCEMALTEAKRSIATKVHTLTPDMRAELTRRAKLTHQLMLAVETKELYLVFQPKVKIPGGVACSAECLIRWQTADGRMIPPSEFIPLAESGGLITRLDFWVFERACQYLHDWKKAGIEQIQLAVNVSAKTFYADGFLPHIENKLKQYDVSPQLIEIEITEYSVIEDAKRASEHINQLHDLGVFVAIDDFGIGNSNIDILLTLPVQHIKIDQSFIRQSMTSDKGRHILSGVLSMANNLGLKVTAEGVETAAVVDYLIELGCDQAQGYYFSRPLEEKDYLNYLNTHITQSARAS